MAISNIIDIFEQALRNATFPNIYRLLKENVYTNVEAVSRIHTINGLILMTIISGVVLFTPVAAYYMLKEVYRPMIYLIPFALIISVIRFYYIVYGEPLFFFKKIKHVSAATALQGCFAILLNFILIPRLGLMGAIIANISSKLIQAFYIYYTSLRIKIFRYKVNFILSVMLGLGLILMAVSFVAHLFVENRIIIHVLDCSPIIFSFVVLFYFIQKNKISLKNLW